MRITVRQLTLAMTIGSSAMLAGCYDTGDQALLDELLNEKDVAVDTAKKATEELDKLKAEIETLKTAQAGKDREVEEARKEVRDAKKDLEWLEGRLKDEEIARRKLEEELEKLRNRQPPAEGESDGEGAPSAESAPKATPAVELTEEEKQKLAEEEAKKKAEDEARKKAEAEEEKKRAVAQAAARKKAAAKARKRAAALAAAKKKKAERTSERTRRLDEEYRRKEAERQAAPPKPARPNTRTRNNNVDR